MFYIINEYRVRTPPTPLDKGCKILIINKLQPFFHNLLKHLLKHFSKKYCFNKKLPQFSLLLDPGVHLLKTHRLAPFLFRF